MAKKPQKSGFAEGRSSNGAARSYFGQKQALRKKRLDKRKDVEEETLAVKRKLKKKATKEKELEPRKVIKSSKKKGSKKSKRDANVKKAEEELQKLFEGDPETVNYGALVGGDVDQDEEAELFKAALEERFKKLNDHIAIDNEDYNPEYAHRLLLRSMLGQLMVLLPNAIVQYNTSKKEQAGYVVNAFMSQARDINAELRVGSDVEEQVDLLVMRVISPVFRAFTQMLLAEGMGIKSTVSTQVSEELPKEAKIINSEVDKVMKNLGKFMDEAMAKIADDVRDVLSGDSTYVNSNQTTDSRKKKKSG